MLSAKWIRQADPFRLAQISPAAEWNQGRTQHIDRIYEKQICSNFLKEYLIYLQFF